MFRKKKNTGAFDDLPSPEATKPKTTKVEGERTPNYVGVVRGGRTIEEVSQPTTDALKPITTSVSEVPNYEGNKRGRKYEVEEVKEAEITWVQTKSDVDAPYPDVVGEMDKYVVDTRIWDRVERYVEGKLDGAGGDGGPHTHNAYADKDHTHKLEDHIHDEYASFDEFADLKNQVEEHLLNHPEGGGDGGTDPEPPEGPHWEFSYTNKFVRNQDGARWDNGGDGVSNQQAWLPDRDAEGNRFLTETQYEVKVEDEDGNRSSWANYRATYFPQNGVQGYLIDFEAWGLLEGDVLYYEPSRKWVSGNKANDEVINRLFSEVDELKARLQKHSHNYNGRFEEQ